MTTGNCLGWRAILSLAPLAQDDRQGHAKQDDRQGHAHWFVL